MEMSLFWALKSMMSYCRLNPIQPFPFEKYTIVRILSLMKQLRKLLDTKYVDKSLLYRNQIANVCDASFYVCFMNNCVIPIIKCLQRL